MERIKISKTQYIKGIRCLLDENIVNRETDERPQYPYRHHEKALQDQFIPFVKEKHREADIELALQIARQHIIDDMVIIPDSEADFI